MSDESAYIRDFKEHSAGEPGTDELDDLEKELYGASDRAVAIMLGAFAEAALTKYLKAQLRQDMNSKHRRAVYDYDGPLGHAALQTPDRPDVLIPVQGFRTAIEPDWDRYSDLTKPQNRFRAAVHTISARMFKQREQRQMANALAVRPALLP